MRRHSAGHRECARAGGSETMGARQSRPARSGVPVGPRGQGHVHVAEYVARSAVMSGWKQISAAIGAAPPGGNPALIAFLTAGYPSRERFREHLRLVAAG